MLNSSFLNTNFKALSVIVMWSCTLFVFDIACVKFYMFLYWKLWKLDNVFIVFVKCVVNKMFITASSCFIYSLTFPSSVCWEYYFYLCWVVLDSCPVRDDWEKIYDGVGYPRRSLFTLTLNTLGLQAFGNTEADRENKKQNKNRENIWFIEEYFCHSGIRLLWLYFSIPMHTQL